MSENKTRFSRRNFLLTVGAGGAAGAAAMVAKSVPPGPSVTTTDDKKTTRGYHATAHIRNYYRTAKV